MVFSYKYYLLFNSHGVLKINFCLLKTKLLRHIDFSGTVYFNAVSGTPSAVNENAKTCLLFRDFDYMAIFRY